MTNNSKINKNNYLKTQCKKAVIVFSKYPEEGKVKTRIANTLGNEFALTFHKECTEHTLIEVLKINSAEVFFYLFFTENKDREKIKSWTDSKFLLELQEGIDLGEKMLNAFKKVISSGSEKTIIIGTDIPDISADILNQAFNALDESDIVIGPSSDGGYYLIGMKKLYIELFSNINWSTNSVLTQTLKIIDDLKLSYFTLTELIDIDTEEALITWFERNSNGKDDSLKKRINSFYVNHIQMK